MHVLRDSSFIVSHDRAHVEPRDPVYSATTSRTEPRVVVSITYRHLNVLRHRPIPLPPHIPLPLFQTSQQGAHPRGLVAAELPRPQVGREQLVDLLERPALELGQVQQAVDPGEEGQGAPDVGDFGAERGVRRVEQVGRAERHEKGGDDVDRGRPGHHCGSGTLRCRSGSTRFSFGARHRLSRF